MTVRVRVCGKRLRNQCDREACEKSLLLYTDIKVAQRLISFGVRPSPSPLTVSVTTLA